MSLILDALKKAEREQDGAPPPDNDEPPTRAAVGDDDQRVRWLFVSVAVLALLVVILLAVLLWPRQQDTAPPIPSEPVVTAPASEASSPGASAPAPEAVIPARLQTAVVPVEPQPVADPQVQALYETQVAAEVEQVVEPQVKTVEPTGGPSRSEGARAADLWREMKAERAAADRDLQQFIAATNASAPPAAAPQEPPAPAEEPPADGLAGYEEVPYLHDLSVPVQNTIPSLMYSAHDYAAGTVTINKRQWREGDSIAQDLVLEKLVPDGIVLRFNERRFKLSALNSWVNY